MTPFVVGLAWLALVQTPPTTQPTDAEAARTRWNEVYQRPKPSFNVAPNAFLQHCLDRLPREGVALDIAMGQGRNAVILARHGLTTTGIDISDEAIRQAEALARREGVIIRAVQADVFTFDYGDKRWDVVSLIYFNPARPILEKLKSSVKPGGWMVIEGFGRRKQGGPPDDTKFDTNELLRRFADWHIHEYHDGDSDADWGGEPRAHVIRLLARRPPEK